jgi:hypothetical protein
MGVYKEPLEDEDELTTSVAGGTPPAGVPQTEVDIGTGFDDDPATETPGAKNDPDPGTVCT